MEEHCHYVWKTYLEKHKARHFAVLAHSAGGRCVASLFAKRCRMIPYLNFSLAILVKSKGFGIH